MFWYFSGNLIFCLCILNFYTDYLQIIDFVEASAIMSD